MPVTFGKTFSILHELFILEPPLFLYIVTSFIRFPLFQSLVYEKVCHEKYGFSDFDSPCSNKTFAHQDNDLQTRANHIFLYSTLCLSIPSIFLSIILGSISDNISRKVPILIPFTGLMLQDLNDLVQTTYVGNSVYYLLISDLLFGVCGGFISLLSTIFAYAIHQSKTLQHRSYRMALLEGTLGVGGTVGYLISGILLRKLGYQHVFLLCVVLHFLSFVYIVVFVPDLCAERNDPESGDEPPASCFAVINNFFSNALSVVFKEREGNLRTYVILILLAFASESITFAGSQDINLYYLKHQLGWGAERYGYFSGIQFGAGSFAILFIFPLLRKYCLVDTLLAEIGLLTKCIGLICMAFVFSTWFAYSICIFYTFSRFIAAGLRTTVSRLVEPDEHGKIFGAIGLVEGICSLIATSVFNVLYPVTLSFFPGFSYIILTLVLSIAVVFTAIVHINAKDRICSEIDAHEDTEETGYGSFLDSGLSID